jgi:thiamine-monophosphate kinase
MAHLAKRYDVAIVGGETTTNPDRLLVSVSLLGWVPRGKAALRFGAKPGDAIFVTGELGGSLTGKHLTFEPRLVEARWLAESFQVHSMMDISDGLAGDLRHILKASGVGAELLASAIPISREAKSAERRLHASHEEQPPGSGAPRSTKLPLLAALTDGEDFELLFTLATKDAVPLSDAWKQQFPRLRLSCIGKITEKLGLQIRDKQGLTTFQARGYEHFRQ